MFLIYIGMVTDPMAIISDVQTLTTGLALTVAVYTTKFVAAWLTARLLHYSRDEVFVIWGLSQAQAAATLATILVGVEINLFPLSVFNGAIMMILFTSVTSPLLVQRFGTHLHMPEEPQEKGALFDRILVPIANPQTQEHLITLASVLACTQKGTLYPLHVAQMTNQQAQGLEHQQKLLESTEKILEGSETQIQHLRRVDTSIAKGILHAAIESKATLIVMGWRGKPTFRQSIFGTVLDEVVWDANIPVLVGRLMSPINALEHVVLVIPPNSFSARFAGKALRIAATVAKAINVPLLALASDRYITQLEEELGELELGTSSKVAPLGDNIIQEVTQTVKPQDLIIVTTRGSQMRFRSSLGPIPEQLANATSGSMVVIHYP